MFLLQRASVFNSHKMHAFVEKLKKVERFFLRDRVFVPFSELLEGVAVRLKASVLI